MSKEFFDAIKHGNMREVERRLMQDPGPPPRKYAGRAQQVITGAIGDDAWEWGLTLYAKSPMVS